MQLAGPSITVKGSVACDIWVRDVQHRIGRHSGLYGGRVCLQHLEVSGRDRK